MKNRKYLSLATLSAVAILLGANLSPAVVNAADATTSAAAASTSSNTANVSGETTGNGETPANNLATTDTTTDPAVTSAPIAEEPDAEPSTVDSKTVGTNGEPDTNNGGNETTGAATNGAANADDADADNADADNADADQTTPTDGAPVAAAPSTKAEESIDSWMPNKALQQIVLPWLQSSTTEKTWASVADITKADMLYLTELDNRSSKVPKNLWNTVTTDGSNFSLEGLQYATNLKKLTMTNQLNNPSTSIRGNLVDVSLLRGLTSLQYVNLSLNRIEDVTPLTELPNVTHLDVAYNSIRDLSSIVKSRYTAGLSYTFQMSVWDDELIYIDPDAKVNTYWPVTVARKEAFPSGTDLSSITTEIPTGTGQLVFFDPIKNPAYAGMGQAFYNGAGVDGAAAFKPVINADGSVLYGVVHGESQYINQWIDVKQDGEKYRVYVSYWFYLPKFIYENGAPVFWSFTPYLVKADLATLNAHNSEIYVGDSWTAEDNFDDSLNHEGNPLDFGKVTVSGTVDTTTAGDYPITYSYGSLTKTVTVKVKENQAQINAKDTTIYVGDIWKPADTFISATDRDGNDVSLDDLEVTHAVNTGTPGKYPVTYTMPAVLRDGSAQPQATKEITVTVLKKTVTPPAEDKTALNIKPSTTLTVGDDWTAADNFISAFDRNGNAVDFTAISVLGTVDTSKPGVYQVTYAYGGLTKIATITVNAADPTDPTDPVDPTDPTGPTDPTKPVGPTDPTKPTLPITGGDQPTAPVEQPATDKVTLPQTGERQTQGALWAILAVGLTGVAAVHFWLRKRA